MVPPRELWPHQESLRLRFELKSTRGNFTERADYLFVEPMLASIRSLLEYCYPTADKFRHDCLLAILELYGNSNQHGNCNDPTAKICLEVLWRPHQMLIGIRDEGNFYQLPVTRAELEAKRPIPTNRANGVGGGGWPIILEFADVVHVNQAQNTCWIFANCPVGDYRDNTKGLGAAANFVWDVARDSQGLVIKY